MNQNTQNPLKNAGPGLHRSLVALSLVSALAFAASAHAATLCVNQNPTPGCVATISAAVAAASSGDTVTVAPGTYREDVVLGKSLSLIGQDRATTIIDAKALSNGVYVDGFDNPGLTQVVVTGFTIENANFEGVLVQDASDVTIWGNSVHGNDLSLQPSSSACPGLPAFETSDGNDCGQGIHLIGVDHSTITFNDVELNAGGILVSDETATSHDNAIARNWVKDNAYNGGITLASHLAFGTGAGTKLAYGIYDNSISNNDCIHNGGAGVGLFAVALGERSYANSVVGNRLIGNSMSGIAIHNQARFSDSGAPPNPDVNNNVLVGNYVAGNGPDPDAPTTVPTGISIFGVTPIVDTVIADNVIVDEDIDLAMNSASTLNIHLNAFLGKVGIANLNPLGQINAVENWWGCNAGPGKPGCSTIVGQLVAFTPWLTLPTTTVDQIHTHDHDNDCDHPQDCDHNH